MYAQAPRLAVVLLLVAGVRGQTNLWPPVLLSAPSEPGAPRASAVLLPGKSMTVAAVAVDGQDNVYLAGWGNAADLPGLERGFKARPDGIDAFVAKLDRTGAPLWATCLGGTDRRVLAGRIGVIEADWAHAIAVDAAGQVYVAGQTGTGNFPVAGAFQSSLQAADGFVTKLSADGRRVIYSSYYGVRDGRTSITGIAAGPAGEVWLQAQYSGQPPSTTHDLTGGSVQIGTDRAVVLKLNPTGMPVWSTRLGLSAPGGFAVDAAGQPHMAGVHCPTVNANECRQAVVRLDTSGSRLHFVTPVTTVQEPIGLSNRPRLALAPDGRAVITGVNTTGAYFSVVGPTGELETERQGIGGVVTVDNLGRIIMASQGAPGDPLLVRPLVDHHVDGPLYVSRDRATTWTVAGRESLPSSPILDLAFDPWRGSVYMVAGSVFGTLYEARSDGGPWQLDRAPGGAMVRIAVDARQPPVRYSILEDHVYRHDDGSPSWRQVLVSRTGFYQRVIKVNPLDSSVWAAGTDGVYVSGDGGRTWVNSRSSLPTMPFNPNALIEPATLVFHPTQAGAAYLATSGLYQTTNNGASWQHLTAAFTPVPLVRGVAFDPARSEVMYAATLNYGLLRSADAGRTWARTLESGRITVVATDHMKRHVVYAGGTDADGRPVFYRSIDWGQTWHRASTGLDMRAEPSRLIVDPRDSSRLFLGTSAFAAVPYIVRWRPTAATPRTYAPDFASYLGAGTIRAMTTTASGELVVALSHTWQDNPDHLQTVVVGIAP